MAKTIEKVSLLIQFKIGTTADGKTATKVVTIAGVNPSAKAEDIYAAGAGLGGLCKTDVLGVYCTEKNRLSA